MSIKNAILNYDLAALKRIANKNNVNEVIFNIFSDDSKPSRTPLVKVSTLKKERYENKRYNGIESIYNSSNDCKLAKVLIKAGADLNYKDSNGQTALMYCIYSKNFKLLKLLVKAGADLNIKNNNGMTALLIAAYSNKRRYAEYLIKAGADKTIKNNNGEDYYSFEKLQNQGSLN